MEETHVMSGGRLHFIGIGGISMSSLAAIAAGMGASVSGSDRTASALTDRLGAEGIKIYIGQRAENIAGLPDSATVIYTAAIAPENPELAEAARRGLKLTTRAAFLGELMKGWKKRIGIAGTHGKSTTTAMTALIAEKASFDPTVVNGAVMREYDGAYKVGGREYFIFEACEYTDSFLSFYPTTAAVTNVDFDHADYFADTAQYTTSFRRYINSADIAAVNIDLPNARGAIEGCSARLCTCGLSPDALYTAKNIVFDGGFASFDAVRGGETLFRASLSVPGLHNVADALTASAAMLENGAPAEAVKAGLESFRGIKRRFEYLGELAGGARLFDDYAHHPAEIKATLAAAKGLGGRIICVYQPHSVSRTAELFEDFTGSFGDADEVIFADIYENLEHDTGEKGVTSADLAARVKNSRYISDFDEITAAVRADMRQGDIVITMGAGDIFKIANQLLDGGVE